MTEFLLFPSPSPPFYMEENHLSVIFVNIGGISYMQRLIDYVV